ncbi:MAG: cytochrome c [Planctomycetota bacterium]
MLDLRLFLPKRVPLPLITVILLAAVASWLPLTMIVKSTQVKKSQPRVHLFQDMDNQPKLKAQASSPIFRDGRAMRLPVAGSVARGQLNAGAATHEGFTVARNPEAGTEGAPEFVPNYVTGYPDDIEVDALFLVRGREKFETFCYPCHGKAGYGNGPVNQRATALQLGDATLSWGTNWVPSANLQLVGEDGRLVYGPDVYPNGQLYKVIDRGKGNMAGYGHAIPVEDRWAIVAYIRALQLSQNAEKMQLAMDRADQAAVRTAALDEPSSPAVPTATE